MFRSGRILGAVTAAVNRILCIALAVLLLVVVVKPELLSGSEHKSIDELVAEFIARYEIALAAAGLVLLVLNLSVIQFLLFLFWNSEVRRYISSKTSGGKARVSLDAIERTLATTARNVPEVSKCRLRVYRIGAKRYKVEVLFWIPDDCNVLNITEKLRLILKKRFAQLVTVEADERVFFEISLAGIRRRRRRILPHMAGGPPRDGIDARGQFKGPVYPVDGD